MNFDLTAAATTATLPPATRVAGTLRFDGADGEVLVAVGDRSKEAVMRVRDGMPLSQDVCKRSM